MYTKFIWRAAILLVVIGLFYAFNAYIYNEKQAEFVPGQTVTVTGQVLAVSMEQAAFDGPYLITLQPKNQSPVTIAVPSMGLPLCAAYTAKNIGDVSLIQAGQEFEVRGEVAEDGSIVPCESADHFLRPTPLVVDGFEGEADPSRMNLEMKSWEWLRTTYADGRVITPKKEGVFSVAFSRAEKSFSVRTDCNSMGGSYMTGADGALTLGEMFSTKMYCEGSQEMDFAQALQEVASYRFTSRGELVLEFASGSASIVLR